MNTIRKLLSIIVLNRIRSQVENFLDASQSRGRGTADAVWAHRFIISKALKFQTKFKILGIDLSKAFDTVNRNKLMQLIEQILDPDSVKLYRNY